MKTVIEKKNFIYRDAKLVAHLFSVFKFAKSTVASSAQIFWVQKLVATTLR